MKMISSVETENKAHYYLKADFMKKNRISLH